MSICLFSNYAGRVYVGLTPEVDKNDDHQQEFQEEYTAGPKVNWVSTTNCGSDHIEKVNKDYYKDPLEILEHMKVNNTLESPISTIKGVSKDSKEEDLSFIKEEQI